MPKPSKRSQSLPPMVLPATFEDVRVLIVAQQVKRVEHRLNNPADGEWGFMVEETRKLLRRGSKALCEDVIKSAEAGDRMAHDALLAEYEELRNENLEAPKNVEVYYTRYAKDPPKGNPGPRASAFGATSVVHVRRDIGISLLLAWIYNRFGLPPTHNESNDRYCGVDLLSAAFRRRGIHLSAKRIANIFAPRREEAFSVMAQGVSFFRADQ
jgi:hypothetical protein